MSTIVLNLILGLIPTFALAWSIAADERRADQDRVVHSDNDRLQHNIVFSLVYGLWGLTMAMWNWMRSEPAGWIIFWSILGVAGLLTWRLLIRKKQRLSQQR